ncbi:MAG: hypothetical protein LBR80_04010 [Deltaproteobacteria bacterium]|nr:hypothetical protein [Deltaproteobacteria bacterium]
MNADCAGIFPDKVKDALVQLRSITASYCGEMPKDLADHGFFHFDILRGMLTEEPESASGQSVMGGKMVSDADLLRLCMFVLFEGNRPPDRLFTLIGRQAVSHDCLLNDPGHAQVYAGVWRYGQDGSR